MLVAVGGAGLGLVPLTKSGFGSCGPYGALGFMTILGPLLLILGIATLATQFAIRFYRTR